MEQTTIHNRIDEVLEKIKTKKIGAHSKTFFRLRMVAFIVLLIAICVTSILLCSFIMFTLRMGGQSNVIGFGSQGVLLFFALFPWFLFLFDVMLIGLLGSLMRHTSFGYKVPGMYVLGMILTIIIISGYIMDTKTTFHNNMLFKADKKQLPFFQGAYINIRRAPPEGYGIYRGIVILREGNMLYIDLDDAAGVATTTSVTVDVTNDPRAPHIERGDSVFISGKVENGNITNARLKMAPRLPPPR